MAIGRTLTGSYGSYMNANFWIGLVVGSLILLISLHRAFSVKASQHLIESLYRRDRDKSLDNHRVRNVRISAAVAALGSIYFIYRTLTM